MPNASRIHRTGRTIEECAGVPFSIFDHLDRNNFNVRVGMTADACSGPFSRRLRGSPLRLASSAFYRPLVKIFAENKIRNQAHAAM